MPTVTVAAAGAATVQPSGEQSGTLLETFNTIVTQGHGTVSYGGTYPSATSVASAEAITLPVVTGSPTVASVKLQALMPLKRPKTNIVFVDVGASKGIQRKWLKYRRSLTPVLFEPNPEEAKALRATLSGFADAYVIDSGLSDRSGPQTLNIAEYFGCTSMLQPNMAFLGDYAIGDYYRSKRAVEVDCSRYDELVAAGRAPRPDVIKIDIEGYESRALAGFGELLHGVLGIETEAWLYPAFKDQALLHDLVDQLGQFGLRLRGVERVPGFEGDLVCVNAFFTQREPRTRELDADRRAKFDIMCRVWKLGAA